jgi:Cys-tRNA(Pro)/Cys-tRNA(Cys) deacylase
VELVPVKEIQALTGYVRGGVSPIGAKKPYPVYLDERAMGFSFISVSAGVRGCQILISPEDLRRAVSAKVWAVGRKEEP